MKNVILLDLDGVMITTPRWKADEMHADGYSQFNINAVNNLNLLLAEVDAELWLSSTRRIKKTLDEFNIIFSNRNIQQELKGFLPSGTMGIERKIEIEAFLDHEPIKNFLILDDDLSLNGLSNERKNYWVKTNYLIGFDLNKLEESKLKIKSWEQE